MKEALPGGEVIDTQTGELLDPDRLRQWQENPITPKPRWATERPAGPATERAGADGKPIPKQWPGRPMRGGGRKGNG